MGNTKQGRCWLALWFSYGLPLPKLLRYVLLKPRPPEKDFVCNFIHYKILDLVGCIKSYEFYMKNQSNERADYLPSLPFPALNLHPMTWTHSTTIRCALCSVPICFYCLKSPKNQIIEWDISTLIVNNNSCSRCSLMEPSLETSSNWCSCRMLLQVNPIK